MTKTQKLKEFLQNPPAEFPELRPKERKALAAAHSGMTSGSLTVWLTRQDDATRNLFGVTARAPRRSNGARKTGPSSSPAPRRAKASRATRANGASVPAEVKDLVKAMDSLDLDSLVTLSQHVRRRIEQKLERARKELEHY